MKRIIYVLLAVSLFSLSFTEGGTPKEEIKLEGTFKKSPTKSGFSPVHAYISDETLEIEFRQNFANLSITVESAEGTVVYSSTANVAAGAVYPVDISLFPSGDYILKITDGYGGCLTGYFSS